VWRGRWPDHAASVFTYFGVSLPEFYWGLVFILVFGSTFHLLPSSGYASLSDGPAAFASHLVLPVATLTLTLLAHVTRLTRSSMMEALDSMYVKVARARGLPERLVILRHALRNALIPSITVLAQDFGFLIGGYRRGRDGVCLSRARSDAGGIARTAGSADDAGGDPSTAAQRI